MQLSGDIFVHDSSAGIAGLRGEGPAWHATVHSPIPGCQQAQQGVDELQETATFAPHCQDVHELTLTNHSR